MPQTPEEKQAAFSFLSSLEEHLNRCLPGPARLAEEIKAMVAESKRSGRTPQANFPEGAFLNRFLVPRLHEFLAKRLGRDGARAALLSESFRGLPEYASGTPARSKKHPFSKVIGIQPAAVIRQWRQVPEKALVRSCPDLALRQPSPHTIVFEAKYFRLGGVRAAETALATGIYQAFFYRALPSVPNMLSQRGVRYGELKSALVPQIAKTEVALQFDRANIESAAYGWQVHAHILPLLNPAGSHSILHGDLSGEAAPDDWAGTALQIHLQPSGNPFLLVGSNDRVSVRAVCGAEAGGLFWPR